MVRSDAVINAYLLFCKCILVTPYSFFVDVIHYAFIPLYSRRMIFLWIFFLFFLSHSGTQHVCNCYVRVKAFLFVSLVFNSRAFFSLCLWFICNFMCCMYVQFHFSFTFGVVQHYCDFQQSGGTRFIHCCDIYAREYEKCKKLRQNMKIELVFVFTFMFHSPCPIHPPPHLFSHHLREINSVKCKIRSISPQVNIVVCNVCYFFFGTFYSMNVKYMFRV